MKIWSVGLGTNFSLAKWLMTEQNQMGNVNALCICNGVKVNSLSTIAVQHVDLISSRVVDEIAKEREKELLSYLSPRLGSVDCKAFDKNSISLLLQSVAAHSQNHKPSSVLKCEERKVYSIKFWKYINCNRECEIKYNPQHCSSIQLTS